MNKIINQVSDYVTELLKNELNPGFKFHNPDHTMQVVENIREIAESSDVSDSDLEALTIAAWFHDTGYIDTYEGHEEISVKYAAEFLEKQKYPDEKINRISSLIRATKFDRKPANKLEEIMRDADILHIGRKGASKKTRALRKEWEIILGKKYSDSEWEKLTRDFYASVKFYTEYANREYSGRKLKNLSKFVTGSEESETKPLSISKNKKARKDKSESQSSQRGIETVFRTTSRNHINLSAIADSKANTLISISALIISIVISFLIGKIDVSAQVNIPASILLVTCVLTIVFATLSTKPSVTSSTLTREDVEKKKGNLLFFGNFKGMSVDDYQWSMKRLMEDGEYLYDNLIRDIYYLGLVLNKKYKYLRIAYVIFMYGLILSVIAFLITIY
ncbi:MAG: Pycsar system effector family protein [Calditrichaceae bacterium]